MSSLAGVPESIDSPVQKRYDHSRSVGARSFSPNVRSKRSAMSLGSTESSRQTRITTPSPPPPEVTLPPLQAIGTEHFNGLEPLCEEETEPGSFDLILPEVEGTGLYSLEERSEFLFSPQHLRMIFSNFTLFRQYGPSPATLAYPCFIPLFRVPSIWAP